MENISKMKLKDCSYPARIDAILISTWYRYDQYFGSTCPSVVCRTDGGWKVEKLVMVKRELWQRQLQQVMAEKDKEIRQSLCSYWVYRESKMLCIFKLF